MFKTKGIIDKAFFDEIKKYFISGSIIVLIVLDFIFLLSIGIVIYFDGFSYVNIILILAAVLINCLQFSRLNSIVRINLERMAETTGKREAEYEVSFEDDFVVVHNLESGSISRVEYRRLARFKRSRTVYILFTKTNLFIPIFIDCLSKDEKRELIAFLRSHAPQLKI